MGRGLTRYDLIDSACVRSCLRNRIMFFFSFYFQLICLAVTEHDRFTRFLNLVIQRRFFFFFTRNKITLHVGFRILNLTHGLKNVQRIPKCNTLKSPAFKLNVWLYCMYFTHEKQKEIKQYRTRVSIVFSFNVRLISVISTIKVLRLYHDLVDLSHTTVRIFFRTIKL